MSVDTQTSANGSSPNSFTWIAQKRVWILTLYKISYKFEQSKTSPSKEKVLFGNKHNVPASVINTSSDDNNLTASTVYAGHKRQYCLFMHSLLLHPEDRGSTVFRNADATYQTTRRHSPEHRNLHIRKTLQAVCVNAGWNPQRTKHNSVWRKTNIYIILLPFVKVSLAWD